MRKPISKHALRRALSKVHAEGHLDWKEPIGTVVDRIWHEIERQSFNGGRKKPVARDSLRTSRIVEPGEIEPIAGS